MLAAVSGEIATNSELQQAWHRGLAGIMTGCVRVIVDRAVARGELPASAAGKLARLVHEVIEAQIFRRMTTAQGLDDAFAQHVVDDIVLPMLAGNLTVPAN